MYVVVVGVVQVDVCEGCEGAEFEERGIGHEGCLGRAKAGVAESAIEFRGSF